METKKLTRYIFIAILFGLSVVFSIRFIYFTSKGTEESVPAYTGFLLASSLALLFLNIKNINK
jgi:hypothetical protein